MLKIFYDENIPYAKEFFADIGEVFSFSGRDVSAEQLQDADVLLVRSITKVNEQLLALNSKIKFVGTATIGVDHIDQAYLQQRGITFTNAAGCNAVSVAEYVTSALMVLTERLKFNLLDKRIGIIGAGNTGSRLSEKLDALGINYVLCDPILAQTKDAREFVSLDAALECDIISLHVPLVKGGGNSTFHLLNETRLAALSEQQILINACRGEVIDNQALLALKMQGQGPELVLDVWEGEPNIETKLIPHCQITTAHIAGYSLEGKSRGTQMLYLALSKLLGLDANKQLSEYLPMQSFALTKEVAGNKQKGVNFDHIKSRIFAVYDVRRDDEIFRQQLKLSSFDQLRKNYPVRREFSALELNPTFEPHVVKALGFNVSTS